jgi:hypothetical protein
VLRRYRKSVCYVMRVYIQRKRLLLLGDFLFFGLFCFLLSLFWSSWLAGQNLLGERTKDGLLSSIIALVCLVDLRYFELDILWSNGIHSRLIAVVSSRFNQCAHSRCEYGIQCTHSLCEYGI